MIAQAQAVNCQQDASQIVNFHQRLRWATLRIVNDYQQKQTKPIADFFTPHFLLNRGLAIIARHVVNATFSDAMDLALAWSEEWPMLTTRQRKNQVLTLTPIAAHLLQCITKAMTLPYPLEAQGWHQTYGAPWLELGHGLGHELAHELPNKLPTVNDGLPASRSTLATV